MITNNCTQDSSAKHAKMQIKFANKKTSTFEITLLTTYANRNSNVSIVHDCDGRVVGDEPQEH